MSRKRSLNQANLNDNSPKNKRYRITSLDSDEDDDNDIDHNNNQTKLKNKIMNSSDPITLNVGGIKYQTTLSTLRKYRDCIFYKMFEGKFSLKPSSDGSYFIDRNGKYFQYILDYLRDGTMIIENNRKFLVQHLSNEADFYYLPSFKLLLLSNILTKSDIETLQKWINQEYQQPNQNKHLKWKLLYTYNCNDVRDKDNGFSNLSLRGISSLLYVIHAENRTLGFYIKSKIGAYVNFDDYFVFFLNSNVIKDTGILQDDTFHNKKYKFNFKNKALFANIKKNINIFIYNIHGKPNNCASGNANSIQLWYSVDCDNVGTIDLWNKWENKKPFPRMEYSIKFGQNCIPLQLPDTNFDLKPTTFQINQIEVFNVQM